MHHHLILKFIGISHFIITKNIHEQLQIAKNGSLIKVTPTNSAKSSYTQKTTMINQPFTPKNFGFAHTHTHAYM